jgi:hypothetical protein
LLFFSGSGSSSDRDFFAGMAGDIGSGSTSSNGWAR